MNYYQHHIGDYAADTAYLTLIEDAIYTRLLRVYYRDEAPLPADVAYIARLIGLRTRKEKEALEYVLPQFFALQDDGWHNQRADEEIAAYHDKAETARENGKLGGRPKKHVQASASEPRRNPEETQKEPSPNPEETGSKANHKPITNNQEPIKATATAKATAKAGSYQSSDNLTISELLQTSDCFRANCEKKLAIRADKNRFGKNRFGKI